jgi:hypothetical protein
MASIWQSMQGGDSLYGDDDGFNPPGGHFIGEGSMEEGAPGEYYYGPGTMGGQEPGGTTGGGTGQTYWGCTDPEAANFNPQASQDDGSCYYQGCMDPTATNYNPEATFSGGNCEYESETMDQPDCPEGYHSEYNDVANEWQCVDDFWYDPETAGTFGEAQQTTGGFHYEDWERLIGMRDEPSEHAWAEFFEETFEDVEDALPEGYENWLDYVEEGVGTATLSGLLQDIDLSEIQTMQEGLTTGVHGIYEGKYQEAQAAEQTLAKSGFAGVGAGFFDTSQFNLRDIEEELSLERMGYREGIYSMEEDWYSQFFEDLGLTMGLG